MVDWSSSMQVLKVSLSFQKLLYCLFGLYLWELFQTCGFEWSLITRRRRFTWPLVSGSCLQIHPLSDQASQSGYWHAQKNTEDLINPKSFLFSLQILHVVVINRTVLSLWILCECYCSCSQCPFQWTGNMAILCASTSLMIRTIAIWERRLVVVFPLAFLCAAHWALLYHGIIIVRATWDPMMGSCAVTSTNATFLNINFFYTMGFDFIIFCFATAALLRTSSRSGLWKLLFQDGLVYWGVTFAINALPAILNCLNLNGVFSSLVPAACFSAIAACRAVIRLQDYQPPDYYIHSASGMIVTSSGAARTGQGNPPRFTLTRPEVQITTDRITMQEFERHLPQASDVDENKAGNLLGPEPSGREPQEDFEDDRSKSIYSIV
ncbi:hypothetical protein BD410DRAFT_758075 [Rickenella mellea]|uniref:Uncharacterized protein n=1 Tax=Rickenella mellea TaxID=50990 RepID=A0A4R5XG43_9AGAM|nr:hypothetical protein BD410DRAFT_758075 [Rickenella mellea]